MTEPGTDVIARRVVVTGRVQGVYFRAQTVEVASALGVHGWVANRSDGAVEAHLEGREAAVMQVIAWMHHGPVRAHVEAIDVSVVPATGVSGFAVRPSPA